MSHREPLNLAFIGAYPPELSHIARLYKAPEFGHQHVVFADQTAFVAAGVGPVAAAFGLTHFLKQYQPRMIVTLGTAGTLVNTLAVGSVCVVKQVSVASYAQDVYGLSANSSLLFEDPQSPHLSQLQRVNVFAPQEITHSNERAEMLCKAGYHAEHLESFAYAFVCRKMRVPFISLLGIVNEVGPHAHAQWKQNEQSVCAALADVASQITHP